MGYYNLGETVDPKTDKVNEYSLDYIEKELQMRNWTTVRNNDNSLSFIRSEERAFNGQRCSTKILVTFLNDKEKCYELKVMSHGFSLSVEELSLDKELKSGDAMEQIKVVARFLDSSRMCRGIPLEKEHVSKHQLGTNIIVAVSYIGQTNRPIENRMFSGRCKIIAPANQCCTSCSSAKRNETKRRNRQNSVGKGKSNPRENYRYLSEVGIAKKLAEQKQQLKNARAREKWWKRKFEEQLIQLEESDHNDLQSIILDDTCNQNVPPQNERILGTTEENLTNSLKTGIQMASKVSTVYVVKLQNFSSPTLVS